MIAIPTLEKFRILATGGMSKTTTVVQWDRSEISYLVVLPGKSRFACAASGLISRDDAMHPFEQLAIELKERGVSSRRLIVLLSRAKMEVGTLKLPPCEPNELP